MLDSVDSAPDGHLIAVSGFGPTHAEPPDRIYELRVFDVQAGKPKWSHMGRGEQACSLTFAPDGKKLAVRRLEIGHALERRRWRADQNSLSNEGHDLRPCVHTGRDHPGRRRKHPDLRRRSSGGTCHCLECCDRADHPCARGPSRRGACRRDRAGRQDDCERWRRCNSERPGYEQSCERSQALGYRDGQASVDV